MLLLVLLSTLVNINSTLKLQTSKVLTNFQGEKLKQSNHTEHMIILKNELEFEIQQQEAKNTRNVNLTCTVPAPTR